MQADTRSVLKWIKPGKSQFQIEYRSGENYEPDFVAGSALEILFATGMRVGELVKITLQDWREDEKSFLVHGKGSRQRLSFLPDDRR
jgi:integrase